MIIETKRSYPQNEMGIFVFVDSPVLFEECVKKIRGKLIISP